MGKSCWLIRLEELGTHSVSILRFRPFPTPFNLTMYPNWGYHNKRDDLFVKAFTLILAIIFIIYHNFLGVPKKNIIYRPLRNTEFVNLIELVYFYKTKNNLLTEKPMYCVRKVLTRAVKLAEEMSFTPG